MTQNFQGWLDTQIGGDWTQYKVLHQKIKTAQGNVKGKRQTDLAVVENVLNHIVTSGVYPNDPTLEEVDFSTLI